MYPLVNVYITMENHHAINGKIHYKWPFSLAMLNYQRVTFIMFVLGGSVIQYSVDQPLVGRIPQVLPAVVGLIGP